MLLYISLPALLSISIHPSSIPSLCPPPRVVVRSSPATELLLLSTAASRSSADCCHSPPVPPPLGGVNPLVLLVRVLRSLPAPLSRESQSHPTGGQAPPQAAHAQPALGQLRGLSSCATGSSLELLRSTFFVRPRLGWLVDRFSTTASTTTRRKTSLR